MIDLYEYENNLYAQNIKYIGGVDEVGRGPLVGPVVAAAVLLSDCNGTIAINNSTIAKTTAIILFVFLIYPSFLPAKDRHYYFHIFLSIVSNSVKTIPDCITER